MQKFHLNIVSVSKQITYQGTLLPNILLVLFGSVASASAQSADYLSGPTPGDPSAIAWDHLRTHRGELGLDGADLDDALERRFETRRHRTTHVYLRQRVRGLEPLLGVPGQAALHHPRQRGISVLTHHAERRRGAQHVLA